MTHFTKAMKIERGMGRPKRERERNGETEEREQRVKNKCDIEKGRGQIGVEKRKSIWDKSHRKAKDVEIDVGVEAN